jgi:hypothetical protein
MTAKEHFDRIGNCGDYPAQPVCTATVEQIQSVIDDAELRNASVEKLDAVRKWGGAQHTATLWLSGTSGPSECPCIECKTKREVLRIIGEHE